MLLAQPIRQVAYATTDVRKAAARHSALYGSGPFLVTKLPPLPSVHRGKEGILEMTVAFGQWGAMQVEFMQQDNTGPSVVRDLYPEGSRDTVLHHLCCIVDDLDTAIDGFARAGYAEVSRLITSAGDAVFIDTLANEGHFIELYQSTPTVVAMYDTVANAALGFDGSNAVRESGFLRLSPG
jgi:hypothetical protein